MSYCRWSCDNFKSDLYVYAHCDGSWTIHVAGNRYPEALPAVPTLRDLCQSKVTTGEYAAGQRRRSAAMEAMGTVPLTLPRAGDTIKTASPGECADWCERLAGLGYHVPSWVIPELREEATTEASQAQDGYEADTIGEVNQAPSPPEKA